MEQEIFLSKDNLISHLLKKDPQDLFQKAERLSQQLFNNVVHFRGLIEFSNICEKNCYYCGIRKDLEINRYQMSQSQIVKTALWAHKNKYGSILLQAAELNNENRISFLVDTIKEIKKLTCLGITLSLGELEKEAYLDLYKAGAHRYLLRIETSNKFIYEKIHPKDHSFENRVKCLEDLKNIGYQTGTGVMIGLPFQTIEDLADDLIFFKDIDIDMIGMGPYIPHEKTPLFKHTPSLSNPFELSLKMIALARVYLHDINIAASSALQAINPLGREKAMQVGANIIMPIITPTIHRKNYLLYPNKPCVNDSEKQCKSCLEKRLASINKTIGYSQFGDSYHYFKRKSL